MFEDNHEFFGDLYSELADQVDIFAEQVRILWEYPMSKLVDYLSETTLVEYSLPMSAVEMQKSLCDDLMHISSEMIVFIDATDADPTTQDFIISAKQAIDKRIWMLRAMLGKK